MAHAQEMLKTHSHHSAIDPVVLAECIEACLDCEQTCTSCADACLGEQQHRDMLIRCIRLNQDCANICDITGQLLSRQTEPDWGILRAQVQLCAQACRICGAECQKHADMHDHCRVCAESCNQCAQACNNLLGAIPGI